jgi:4'-phosphopantetheinyl transferase
MRRPVIVDFARYDPWRCARRDVKFDISPRDVVLWGCLLAGGPDEVDAWAQWLSADELARANRFLRAADRDSFIIAHGVLRHLLARCCDLAPAQLRFDSGSAGKPSLRSVDGADPGITFSLAHCAGRALVVVGRGRAIGADLECGRDDVDVLDMANRLFEAEEAAAIAATHPDRRRDAFFRHWVAKEAVLKAEGVGLSLPLDQFAVRFLPDGSRARAVASPDKLAPDWTVRMLPLRDGWHGAVASHGGDWVLRPGAGADA